MSETNNPEGLGIDAAAAQFANILGGEPEPKEEGETPVETEAEVETESEEPVEEQEAGSEEVESEEEVSEEEPPAPKTYKVKVQGKEVEVTEDDLIKSYSKGTDYYLKTQALAEQRKSFEAEQQAVLQERAEYAQVLSQLKAQLQQATANEPDWDALYDQDPIEASKLERKWRTYQAQKEAILAEQQRVAELEKGEQVKALRARLQVEQAKVLETLPEWKDEAKAKEGKTKLISYGKLVGFNDEELSQVYDSRMVRVLADAAAYNELKAKKQTLQPVKTNVKQAAPSSASVKQTSAITKAKQRLAKTGRVEDAAQVFKGLI